MSQEMIKTTCYMCACRCGIRVHLDDGKIRFIDGNPDHPVNKGVLCAKGSAGIMQQYSPAKLTAPMRRVGPRGSGEFETISWDEALQTATDWLSRIRADDPRKLAFFTGRDQSQGLTGFWASQFGTPNHAAHGGFCSVNMAAGGLYSIGGSFWEFGEPDWEHTRIFMMFGVAEDHDSNPIKMGLGKLKGRQGTRFISVNPIRTGYSAIADEWIGITPGTDGLFVLALVHELLRTQQVDLKYLVRYTNAPWLVIDKPGDARHGLIVRGKGGEPMVYDRSRWGLVSALEAGTTPALHGRFDVDEGLAARPVFELILERYQAPEYAPDAVAASTGIEAETIRRLAAELARAAFEEAIELPIPWTDWAGRKHATTRGRPVAMHAMRGISAHSNGFQTCRAIHLLQTLLGAIDCPGGFRYKPPFPKPAPPAVRPAGKPDQVRPNTPLPGPPLGFVSGPEDLLLDDDGQPARIDKAYSWEAPLAAHGLMHMVIRNAFEGDPYPIDTLFMFMANMSWNSSMNSAGTMEMLTAKDEATGEYRIPRIIYSDAYDSEMIAYADLILPDTTYFERWDAISLLDRPISSAEGPADAIRQPVLEPDRDVRPFQDVLIELGARLGLPAFCTLDGGPRYPGGYPDYIVNHERTPGVGPLAGWRDADGSHHGVGAPNPDQLQRYIENGCFWQGQLPAHAQYYKHANQDYLAYASQMGWIGSTAPIVMQLYSEPLQKFRLAADGHGELVPPAEHRDRIAKYFDPLPAWYAPLESESLEPGSFPLHALTQRPMAMYHSWGSQNAWLRQIHTANRLYLHTETAAALNLEDDDWVWVSSRHSKIRCQIRTMRGVNPNTVWTWNAIGKKKGAWNLSPEAPESSEGFLLNHLISELLPPRSADAKGPGYGNYDPITGQAAWFDLQVRIEKSDEPGIYPQFPAAKRTPGIQSAPDKLRFGARRGEIKA